MFRMRSLHIPKGSKISKGFRLRRTSGTTPVIRRVSIHGVMIIRRRKAEVVGLLDFPSRVLRASRPDTCATRKR